MSSKPRTQIVRFIVIAVIGALTNLVPAASAATPLLVDSPADTSDADLNSPTCATAANVCTLRAAIEQANASTGLDQINFAIGTGHQTITPGSALPTIVDPVFINGTSQPGYDTPVIELNGEFAGSVNGLVISAGSSQVAGLAINRFSGGSAIRLETLGFNKVNQNFLGTNVTGTSSMSNGSGVTVSDSPQNLIQENVISGNGTGVSIQNPDSIANWIRDNRIGTTPDGNTALGNSDVGIKVLSGADSTIIGGTALGDRNNISENSGGGVVLNNADNNLIQGNHILGNQSYGVSTANGASDNIIGGANTTGGGNDISDNWSGVALGSSGNQVQGNEITDNSFLPEFAPGRGVVLFAGGNEIGGSPAEGNTIAHNDQGVVVAAEANHSPITGNSIHDNDGGSVSLGIDLLGDGVTPNDPQDADTGANDQQNFPELSFIRPLATSTVVEGSLNSLPDQQFTLEFFANGLSENEGEIPLGRRNVTTDGNGDATFAFQLPKVVSAQMSITATATDVAGSTSEFSAPTNVCTKIDLEEDDSLVGSPGRDVLCGLGGPDDIRGKGGADIFLGDLGNDRLVGGPGNDLMSGGKGSDVLLGSGGNDKLNGGQGKDILKGQAGNDGLNGGPGTDTCIQGPGSGKKSSCEK